MTQQVCGLIDQTKGCCLPCQATFARLTLCEGETNLQNCPSAQQCISTGLASAATVAPTHRSFWNCFWELAVTFIIMSVAFIVE